MIPERAVSNYRVMYSDRAMQDFALTGLRIVAELGIESIFSMLCRGGEGIILISYDPRVWDVIVEIYGREAR